MVLRKKGTTAWHLCCAAKNAAKSWPISAFHFDVKKSELIFVFVTFLPWIVPDPDTHLYNN